jgi:hypothetical protein
MKPEKRWLSMPFIDDAKTQMQKLPFGSVERCILEFLLANAVGRHKAVTWPTVKQHLEQHGHSARQQTFQQGLLKQSREGSVFIGSNDHGVGQGYFLIQDKEDAEVMRRFYRRRIEVEQGHLTQLDKLIDEQFT